MEIKPSSTRKRLRNQGFLKRSKTKTGKNILKRRRRKGRSNLTI